MVKRKVNRPAALVHALELKRALREASREVEWAIAELRHRYGEQPSNEPLLLTETELGVLRVAFDEVDDCFAELAQRVERRGDPRQMRLVEVAARCASCGTGDPEHHASLCPEGKVLS